MKAGALRSLMRENVDPVTFVDLWDLVTEKFNRYAAAEQAALYRAMHALERLQDRRRNSSSAAQLLAAQDQARTLRELCEKRSFITKPANTKPDRMRDHESPSPRTLSVVEPLQASGPFGRNEPNSMKNTRI